MNYGAGAPENLSELPTKGDMRCGAQGPGTRLSMSSGAHLCGILVCCLVIRFAC